MLPFVDAITRREWLRIGALGALGHGLTQRSAQAAQKGFGRAKSVVLIFTHGGQSQLEMWDPKPTAPLRVRGEFGTIRTSTPGVHLGEHIPRIAQQQSRYAIVRTMSHEDSDHGSACYLTLTGRYHAQKSGNPPPRPDDQPVLGAMLHRVRPTNDFVHSAVHINGPALVPILIGPGQTAGLLGRECDPLVVGDVTQEPILFPGLSPQPSLPPVRLESRRSLLSTLDAHWGRVEQSRVGRSVESSFTQAFDMLSRPETRNAFDLSSEPDALRDRYGRDRSGQSCLLARRLVEAGVPLITVMWNHTNRGQDETPGVTDQYGWDTHNDIFYALKEHLLPRFDVSLSTFLEDMDERGLLDDTLVICLGEFGRAPLVALEPNFAGATPGRKHWPQAYSIVFAGAGTRAGEVIGETDAFSAYPASQAFGPWDIAATVFHALGIDPSGHFTDPAGRQIPLTTGRPMHEVFA